MPRYYTVREVCAVLGVSRAGLYYWQAHNQADLQLPGSLGFTKRTVEQIARKHGRVPDWSKVPA